ncbi:MAG: class I SAM-dependent methyltransferase [Candidatus Zixiibacteriota bacterium]
MAQRKDTDTSDWYRRTFCEDYLWLYAHRSEREAQRQVALALRLLPFKRGQRVLDLACGAGRHTIALARRGARVTGVDLSADLLKAARMKMREKQITASLVRKDMRRLDYRGQFDGAMMWFTSFGYFPNKRDDKIVLKNIAAALKPGGWWWIDLPHPDWLKNNLIAESCRTVEGPHGKATVCESRWIDGGRVKKRVCISDSVCEKVLYEDVRLYYPEEFAGMIKAVGLSASGVLGNYRGEALTPERPRQIWFGIKGH